MVDVQRRHLLARAGQLDDVERPGRVLRRDILGDDEALATSLSALRRELDEIDEGPDEAEAVAETIPHRTRYLQLVHRLGRQLVQVHHEWLDGRELQAPAQRR